MTNSEKPPAPEVVISTVGLNLKALIAAMEREAFEAWYGIAYDTASLRPIEDGCYTKRGGFGLGVGALGLLLQAE